MAHNQQILKYYIANTIAQALTQMENAKSQLNQTFGQYMRVDTRYSINPERSSIKVEIEFTMDKDIFDHVVKLLWPSLSQSTSSGGEKK